MSKNKSNFECNGLHISLPTRAYQYRCRYQGQFYHQPAYLELDPESKTLTAGYSGEIGNAIPMAVYHGTVLRFTIPPMTKLRDVRSLMTWIAPACARLVDSYDEKWDGHNFYGVWDNDILDWVNHEIGSAVYETPWGA